MKVHSAWRAVAGAAGFLVIAFLQAGAFLGLRLRGKNTALHRALWLQRFCRRLVRLLRIRADYRGTAADAGVLVTNHVSYIDVVVLAAWQPMVFVAKKEVRSWPLIGWLAALAGTIFIDRSRRGDVARVNGLLSAAITQGVRVCIFPEGTSSDGSRVLPFRTSLLEPVIAGAWPVTAGWIGYELEDGRAETDVCYWGEMTFGPHFLNLLSQRRIFAKVAFAVHANVCRDRKQLGRELHDHVSQLRRDWPLE